jgi:ABC-type sugar transport system permease subunit
MIGLVAFPMAYSLWLSFNDVNIYRGLIQFVGLNQYLAFISDPRSLHYVLLTFRLIAEVTICSVALGLAMALFLNEKFPLRRLARIILISPWAISEFATAVIFRLMYNPNIGVLSILSGLFGVSEGVASQGIAGSNVIELLSSAYTWHFAPLVSFFLLGAMQTIPEDLYKAAKMDGAGPLRRFVHVTFQYLKYSLLVSIVLVTLMAVGSTDIVFIMTGGGPGSASEVLSYHVFKQTFVYMNLGAGSAISYFLLGMIFLIVVTYFQLLKV